MQPVKGDLIGLAGYDEKVRQMVADGMLAPEILESLQGDPVFMDAIGQHGYRVFRIRHVHTWLASQQRAMMATLQGAAEGKDASTVALAAAKEQILNTVQLGRDWEGIARRGLSILEQDLDSYEMERHRAEAYNSTEQDITKKRPLPAFPHDLFNNTRKAIVACVQIIQALRDDQRIQGIVRTNTLTVNQGVSQKELHDILFAVGRELGHTRSDTLAAYTKAMMNYKAAGRNWDAINAEPAMPGEGKWEGRLPFVGSLERSAGVVKSAPSEGAQA